MVVDLAGRLALPTVIKTIMAAELYLKPLARKFKRAVEKIQVDLNEHLQYGSIPKFANELFSVKLIPSNIHKKADFNDMMGNVTSGMTVSSTLSDLEVHSCLFLEVLEKMDSKVCDKFATDLENSWISDAKSLNVSLTRIGKRYSTPSQVDDKQSDSIDYRKYFRDKQKSKYSKKKRKNISSDSLKAPQHQVMPRTEENGYLCSDTTESTTSENDANKRLWMTTPLQAQILSGSTSLPPTELVLLKRAAVTVITETPSHNRRTSLSHVFYSDGISGDAVIDALLLQPLIAGNAKNDLKLVSTGQHLSPIVSSSGQQACSPPQSKTNASARTQAAHDSISRGETTDQNGTYYRRRSSSIPDKFPSFPSNQSESKSDGINRTEIVAGGSSSRVSSLITNEQIMHDQFSCLELEEQSASRSTTKLESSNAHHCLSCEKLHEELHQKNTRIAVLEAHLEEKITQIQAQNKIIEQLLSKNN